MPQYVHDLLVSLGAGTTLAARLVTFIMLVWVALLCLAGNFIGKKIVLRLITRYIQASQTRYGQFILQRRTFHRLSHLVPALIIYLCASLFPAYRAGIEKLAVSYIMVIVALVVNSFLDVLNDAYNLLEIAKAKPIKSYVQVMKIFVYIVTFVLIVANLIGENPLTILGGIGALTAVLMLVFQSSILGLVAGIQLTANDMLRIGDWIEMPKYGADGHVTDISLNVVKVENFDKTITTIPTHALISDSFKNWRGMQNAGGRRIKRAFYIDASSVTFCTEEMLERFKKIHYLTDYITGKEKELEEYNLKNNINTSEVVNGRRMTNIGVFRAYIKNYLLGHPKIRKDMTIMVRQLAPSEHGIPMEIYAFTNDTDWIVYENVQSDIFDHIFAVVPEFGLRIFQEPTGHDLKKGIAASLARDTEKSTS